MGMKATIPKEVSPSFISSHPSWSRIIYHSGRNGGLPNPFWVQPRSEGSTHSRNQLAVGARADEITAEPVPYYTTKEDTMGLDMYAYKVKPEHIWGAESGNELDKLDVILTGNEAGKCNEPLIDLDIREGTASQIYYWRKHPNLHGYMEALYQERGGEETFNCIKIRLLPEDLDHLEDDLDMLPETEGFFFGQSRPEDVEDTKKFIELAREAIADGYAVIYDSWW